MTVKMAATLPAFHHPRPRWGLAQLSLFFSVYVCKQVKAPAADASRKE
jgi:hypothetical protein